MGCACCAAACPARVYYLHLKQVAHLQGIYEYGDHGGLLLLASHETEGPADSLKFSLDQGACWHNIRLDEAIDIQNIRSDSLDFSYP